MRLAGNAASFALRCSARLLSSDLVFDNLCHEQRDRADESQSCKFHAGSPDEQDPLAMVCGHATRETCSTDG
jgi:hypothetical protein